MDTLDRVPSEASLFKARRGSLGIGLLLFIGRPIALITNKIDLINFSHLFDHNPIGIRLSINTSTLPCFQEAPAHPLVKLTLKVMIN